MLFDLYVFSMLIIIGILVGDSKNAYSDLTQKKEKVGFTVLTILFTPVTIGVLIGERMKIMQSD